MFKRKIAAGLLGLSLFVMPLQVNGAGYLLSPHSYLRRALRITAGIGLITLFAEHMISYTKNERKLDIPNILMTVLACYNGFKILSKEA